MLSDESDTIQCNAIHYNTIKYNTIQQTDSKYLNKKKWQYPHLADALVQCNLHFFETG